MRDITKRKQAESQIEHLACSGPLTCATPRLGEASLACLLAASKSIL
jgi:hypothetical protein